MLKSFIKEYNLKFLTKFEDTFKGKFEKFANFINEPSFNSSIQTQNRVNFLNSLFYEPLNIAIVGQFSSGKSSFINTLLKEEILPTGIIPVTAKLTYIKYAKLAFLQITYEDSRVEIKELSELKFFVDQRNSLEKVKNITIYHPSEILKKVTLIDTPGLNSLSQDDSNETQNILNEATCLFWISLINNASRVSESEDLNRVLPKILKNSLCLLSQKDRLNQNEIDLVLNYSKQVYKDKFKDVFPISSKLEKENDHNNSGFKAVFDFIDNLESKKQSFISSEVREILNINIQQFENFINIFNQLEEILQNFTYKQKITNEKSELKNSLKQIFNFIKDISMFVAIEITKYLKNCENTHFIPSSAFFKKGYFERKTYEATALNYDQALNSLIYNGDKLTKEFKKLNRNFNIFKDEIDNFLDEIFQDLKIQVEIFANRFENINSFSNYTSNRDLSDIREFASSSYFTILKDYEDEIYKLKLENSLFFSKLSIKIATNYQNSIKETIYFFDEKIRKSYEIYEQNPSFSLYYPQVDEIYQRVLNNLSFYEFEDELIGNKTQIDTLFQKLQDQFKILKNKKLDIIDIKKSFYKDKILKFQNQLQNFCE